MVRLLKILGMYLAVAYVLVLALGLWWMMRPH